MPWFRRGLVAIAVCTGSLVYAVVSWSAFPRNLVGVGVLVLVGAPLALAGEVLADLALGGKGAPSDCSCSGVDRTWSTVSDCLVGSNQRCRSCAPISSCIHHAPGIVGS